MNFLRGLFTRDTGEMPDVETFITETRQSGERASQERDASQKAVSRLKREALIPPPPFENDMFPLDLIKKQR